MNGGGSGRRAASGEQRAGAADEELIAVARVAKTRGVRGEVAAELLTDFPERFAELEELIATTPVGERLKLRLEKQWLHAGRVVLKFAGYDNPEDARELVGYVLSVPASEAVELGKDEYYDWQLIGCHVETLAGQLIGDVREVWHTGAAPVLVIRDEGNAHEHLVPLAKAICTEIDVDNKLIQIDPPEGLLEI
ncbi:MAG: ribosome maturation factor RimM [Acidobacteriota bacterium]|nr:ribosome maturation factor RimM [Acidobacteriota bacterium]